MNTFFKILGSRKVLKQQYLTGYIPQRKDKVVINNITYLVQYTEFNIDLDCCNVWLIKQ